MKIKPLGAGMMFLIFIAGIFIEIVSSVQTVDLFASSAPAGWGVALGAFGVCNEIGKSIFFMVAAILIYKKQHGAALIVGLLWLGCFSISLIASQGFDLNKKNEIQNETVTNSAEYKRQSELFESSGKSIKDLENEINNLKSTKAEKIKEAGSAYDTQIANAKKMWYITTPEIGVNALTDKQNKAKTNKENEINGIISEKETLLNSIRNEQKGINTELKTAGTNISSTKGLIAMAQWANKLTGIDSEKLLGNFYLIKNVFSELLGLGFVFIGQLGLDEESTGEDRKDKPKLIDRVRAKLKRRKKHVDEDETPIQDIKAEHSPAISLNKECDNINTKVEIGRSILRDRTKRNKPVMAEKKRTVIQGFKMEREPEQLPQKIIEIRDIKGVKINNDYLKAYIQIALNQSTKNGDKAPGFSNVKDIMSRQIYESILGTLKNIYGYLEPANTKVQRTNIKDREGLEKLYNTL